LGRAQHQRAFDLAKKIINRAHTIQWSNFTDVLTKLLRLDWGDTKNLTKEEGSDAVGEAIAEILHNPHIKAMVLFLDSL